MIHHTFRYDSPKTLAEAEGLLQSVPGSVIVAGGTDIVPLLKYDLIAPPALIAIGGIGESPMHRIEMKSGTLKIGAAVTLHALAEFARSNPRYRALRDCANAVASPQIRRTGTVGGNVLQQRRCYYYNQSAAWRSGIEPCFMTGGGICHQMPAKKSCQAIYYSDLAIPLAAMSAHANVFQNGAIKRYPILDCLGGGQPVRRGILVSFEMEELAPRDKLYFQKYALRNAIDFPIANGAVCLRDKGLQRSVRMFLGAMAPSPLRLAETEAAIALAKDRTALADLAITEARKQMHPIKEVGVPPKTKLQGLNIVRELLQEI